MREAHSVESDLFDVSALTFDRCLADRNFRGLLTLLLAATGCNCQKYQSKVWSRMPGGSSFMKATIRPCKCVFDKAIGIRASIARAVVYKLATSCHSSQGVAASHESLVQTIILESVGRNISHIYACRDIPVAQFRHVLKFVAQ
jgi:hypothetical protein